MGGLEVGRTIEGEIGIRGTGTQTGHTEVEATGRVAPAEMPEVVQALTDPWQKGWVYNSLLLLHTSNMQSNRDLLVNIPSAPIDTPSPTSYTEHL